MIFFITFLRALAACIITNSHYTGVYPIEIIANGGLIGDILFFAVSGYCLYNVKGNFFKWYIKRIYRIYPPLLIMSVIYILTGDYSLNNHNIIWWLIYPTYYHFIASIVLLYIPYYFIMKFDLLKKKLHIIMSIIFFCYIFIYIIMYDKTYYHIDVVREPMIRFLFMESMLLGAWFRQNEKKYRNKFKVRYVILTIISFIMYFLSKMLFTYKKELSEFQIINQVIIFLLLYFIFRTFEGIDKILENMPQKIKVIIKVLSELTLEIYLVQYVIIYRLSHIAVFPINWFVLTGLIITSAYILHRISGIIYKCIGDFINRESED